MRMFCSAMMILCLSAASSHAVIVDSDASIINVQKVWDSAPYNSFTDAIRYKGQIYLTFRESTTHGVPAVGQPGGNVRILRSSDGNTWSPVALLSFGVNNDLRDPHLSITPDNRLMLTAANAPHTATSQRQSYNWFSSDGMAWSTANPVGDANYWMWRNEWHNGTAYGISYGNTTSGPTHTRLHTSADGINYSTLLATLNPQSGTNEAGYLFRSDGSAVALVRTGGNALIGTSDGDFTSWAWQDSGFFVGGPDVIELPDGRIVAAGRFTDDGTRTALAFLDPEGGTLSKFLVLPSGGDTSYPGLIWHDGQLLVSYYSSHEGKPSIYLARIAFANVPEPASIIVLLAGACIGLRSGGGRRA